MANVQYSVLVSDVRRRVGNVVFSKWKKTSYIKPYQKGNSGNSAGQLAVRSSFSKAVTLWKALPSLAKKSWDKASRSLNMTGFNLFIGTNAKLFGVGQVPELSRENGLERLVSFSLSAGAAAGSLSCVFAYPAGATGATLVLGVQKWVSGSPEGSLRIVEAGIDVVSPYELTGLEAGSSYGVFAFLADRPLAEAVLVSASLGALGTAA